MGTSPTSTVGTSPTSTVGTSPTHRRQGEEGDGEDGEARCDGLPDPGLRHLVPVADGGDRHLTHT